jgi:hypothetical protein
VPKLDLRIVRGNHAPAAAIGRRLPAIRLFADVSVATNGGWSLFETAVIDTGAPVSVFPPAIWKQSRHTTLGRVKIGGLARTEECQVPAILAEIDCVLSDGQHSLGPIRTQAYLVEAENAPSLIGILGFIEHGVLRVDLSKSRAFLRMP